jgi:hypothetical protein
MLLLCKARAELTTIAIDGKQVVGLVSSAEIIDLEPLSLNKMNLASKFVWPGLNNSHVHPEMYPINLQIPECETPLCVLSLHRVAEKLSFASCPFKFARISEKFTQLFRPTDFWGLSFYIYLTIDPAQIYTQNLFTIRPNNVMINSMLILGG